MLPQFRVPSQFSKIVFSPPSKPLPMNRCRPYRLVHPLTGIWPSYGERPDTMFFFHNSIKKNGVICLLLLLEVCLLSSCKTNNLVKAKIATINNECIRNVVDNMLSYADSITDCKYEFYYLIKNQDDKAESFTLMIGWFTKRIRYALITHYDIRLSLTKILCK